MKTAYLGIDVGTSGIRASCIDDDGIEIYAHSIPTQPAPIEAGRCEQTPAIWWQALCEVISEITQKLDAVEIEALAIDGTSGSVLLTDKFGAPLTPALMYNDSSAFAEAENIASIAPINSAVHGASSGLAKLLKLFKQHPMAKHVCHQADWLSSSLTGHFGISDENNCLKTGYDVINKRWPDYIQQLGIPKTLLPKVVSPGSYIGSIKQSIAEKLGLSKNCKVIAGTTDSIAAFIATGATQLGTGVTSLGSTLSIKMITNTPVFSANDGIYSHRLGNVWLVSGASNSGGRVLQQYFSQHKINELTPLLEPNTPTGYNYYPLPGKGERFPINDANLESSVSPIPDSERVHFQALLEGISQIEKLGYEKLQQLSSTKLTQIITSGGGSINTGWTTIRQQIIGTPISTARFTQASYGAALLARQGLR